MIRIKVLGFLDDNNYWSRDIEKGVEVHHVENDMVNQEKYIRLMRNEDGWGVYVHSHNTNQEIGQFKDKVFARGVVIILCFKFFECSKEDNAAKRELRAVAKTENMVSIKAILDRECDKRFYDLFFLKDNAISLIKEDNLYSVYLFK